MSKSFADEFRKNNAAEIPFALPKELSERYTLMELLAENERGDTYLLSESISGKRFILKRYLKSKSVSDMSSELLRELKHKGLPRFEMEIDGGDAVYSLREYVEGMTLTQYVADHGAIADERVVNIAVKLCDILAYLHSQPAPVIHRDIKPSNIIINPESFDITLIDFGISRKFSDDADTDTTYYGTKKFSPPEQYGYAQTDCRTDIYALGVVLRFMLTGATDGTVTEKTLKKIIDRCTAFAPKDRYQNVLAVKRALLKHKNRIQLKVVVTAAAILALCAAFTAGFYAGRFTELFRDTLAEHDSVFAESPYVFADPFVEAAVRLSLNVADKDPVYLSDLTRVIFLGFAWDTAVAGFEEFNKIAYPPDWNDRPKRFGALRDLSDVEHMTNLRSISIAGQSISDLSPLKHCLRLHHIEIQTCPSVTDISFLEGLSDMQFINVNESSISDVTALAGLSRLDFAGLSNTNIRDFSPLSNLPSLRYANLSHNELTSIPNLGGSPLLKELTVHGQALESLDGAERLTALRRLDICHTGVTDFSPLNAVPTLEVLEITTEMEPYLHTLGRDDVQVNVHVP